MADFYPNEMPAATKPVVKRAGAAISGRRVHQIVSFTYAAQAAGSRLMLPKIPKGARGVLFDIQSSDALGGTATLALGIAGTTGKYRAAATLNVTTRERVSSAVNSAAILTADEDPFITTAAAALPASGTLTVETSYIV